MLYLLSLFRSARRLGGTALFLLLPLAPAGHSALAQTLTATALPDAPGFLQASQTQQSAQSAQPQSGTAAIFGLITDVNGGIVPGATVMVLDTAGKPGLQATADSGANFRLDHLPAGTYTLRISAPGLETFQPPPVILKDGEQYELPATSLPIATANTSVDVVVTREEIADEELKQQTKQRVLGILPNFYTSYVWDAAPMNTRQKFKLTFRALTDPWVFARTGIIAGIQEGRGTFPEYGSGVSGYFERYAADYGDVLAGRIIGSAIMPAIFHQDPRYFYRGTGGVPRRTLHALVSAVAARTDHGHVEPNYTRLLGEFSAGYLSRTWHPGSDNGVTLAIDNMLIGIGDTAARNLFQEFVFKHISRGTPKFAIGKPPSQKESAIHP